MPEKAICRNKKATSAKIQHRFFLSVCMIQRRYRCATLLLHGRKERQCREIFVTTAFVASDPPRWPGRHIGAPLLRVVADEVVRLAWQLIKRGHVGRSIRAHELHSESVVRCLLRLTTDN